MAYKPLYAAITSLDPSAANFAARISCTDAYIQCQTPCAVCPIVRGWSSSYIACSDTDLLVAVGLKIVVSQSRHEVSPHRWKIDYHAGQTGAMNHDQTHGPRTSCIVQISTCVYEVPCQRYFGV